MLSVALAAILASMFSVGAAAPTVRGQLARDGVETIDLGGDDGAWALALQPDGKILVGGGTSVARERSRWVLLRLGVDGQLDPGFGRGGLLAGPLGERYQPGKAIRQIAVMPDGRIVFPATDGEDVAVARYRADGSIDPSFGEGDGLSVVSRVDRGCMTPTGLAV